MRVCRRSSFLRGLECVCVAVRVSCADSTGGGSASTDRSAAATRPRAPPRDGHASTFGRQAFASLTGMAPAGTCVGRNPGRVECRVVAHIRPALAVPGKRPRLNGMYRSGSRRYRRPAPEQEFEPPEIGHDQAARHPAARSRCRLCRSIRMKDDARDLKRYTGEIVQVAESP